MWTPWAGGQGGRLRVSPHFGSRPFLPSQKNSSQAGDILVAISRVLGRSPLDFWGAELLAGRDEGALGWITINYVLGLLVKVPWAACGGGWVTRGWGSMRLVSGLGAACLSSVFLLWRMDPASGGAPGGRPGHGWGLHPDQLRARRPYTGQEHPGHLPPLRL